jgi:hypothetical protein
VKYDPPALKYQLSLLLSIFSLPIIVIEQNISPTKNRLFSLLLSDQNYKVFISFNPFSKEGGF